MVLSIQFSAAFKDSEHLKCSPSREGTTAELCHMKWVNMNPLSVQPNNIRSEPVTSGKGCKNSGDITWFRYNLQSDVPQELTENETRD